MFASFLNLIFPSVCCGCKQTLVQGEENLCVQCRFALPTFKNLGSDEKSIAIKFYGKVPISQANAYLKFTRGGMVQTLLHELKYNNRPEIGLLLGQMFGAELAQIGYQQNIDLIVPVPLHARKLSNRGFNQCDGIAQGLSESLGVAWNKTALQKTKATASLSKQKMNTFERVEAVNNVFEIKETAPIYQKRIALIDDVITTGATLEACANSLLSAGAASVNILCLAAKTL